MCLVPLDLVNIALLNPLTAANLIGEKYPIVVLEYTSLIISEVELLLLLFFPFFFFLLLRVICVSKNCLLITFSHFPLGYLSLVTYINQPHVCDMNCKYIFIYFFSLLYKRIC